MGFAIKNKNIEHLRRMIKQDVVMHSAGGFDLRTCLRIFDMVDSIFDDRTAITAKKPGEA